MGLRQTKCPRGGVIWFRTETGEHLAMETSCKTWGCRKCYHKVLRLVQMRIAYGCLIGAPSYFITLTYKLGREKVPDAASVEADLRALLKKLPYRPRWFKVMELTKKGMPHLHLIVNGLGSRTASCAGKRHRIRKKWMMGRCKSAPQCLEHEWGGIWYETTKDSWVVKAEGIWSPKGAAIYLSKYFTKTFTDRKALELLGFKRRWSCSRDWPRTDLKLVGSGSWAYTERLSGPVGQLLMEEVGRRSKTHPMMAYTGNETEALVGDMFRAMVPERIAALWRKINVANVS